MAKKIINGILWSLVIISITIIFLSISQCMKEGMKQTHTRSDFEICQSHCDKTFWESQYEDMDCVIMCGVITKGNMTEMLEIIYQLENDN